MHQWEVVHQRLLVPQRLCRVAYRVNVISKPAKNSTRAMQPQQHFNSSIAISKCFGRWDAAHSARWKKWNVFAILSLSSFKWRIPLTRQSSVNGSRWKSSTRRVPIKWNKKNTSSMRNAFFKPWTFHSSSVSTSHSKTTPTFTSASSWSKVESYFDIYVIPNDSTRRNPNSTHLKSFSPWNISIFWVSSIVISKYVRRSCFCLQQFSPSASSSLKTCSSTGTVTSRCVISVISRSGAVT